MENTKHCLLHFDILNENRNFFLKFPLHGDGTLFQYVFLEFFKTFKNPRTKFYKRHTGQNCYIII